MTDFHARQIISVLHNIEYQLKNINKTLARSNGPQDARPRRGGDITGPGTIEPDPMGYTE